MCRLDPVDHESRLVYEKGRTELECVPVYRSDMVCVCVSVCVHACVCVSNIVFALYTQVETQRIGVYQRIALDVLLPEVLALATRKASSSSQTLCAMAPFPHLPWVCHLTRPMHAAPRVLQ